VVVSRFRDPGTKEVSGNFRVSEERRFLEEIMVYDLYSHTFYTLSLLYFISSFQNLT